MISLGPDVHRILLALLLAVNAVAFAGVDPISRFLTAGLVLLLIIDMTEVVEVPRRVRLAATGLVGLVVLQLLPLPAGLRHLIQPGFAEVGHPGWAPLSLAPWSTLLELSGLVVAAGIALVAARMAASRSGLPFLLASIAATGAVVAMLGLVSEAGAPSDVLLIRSNTVGGNPYGPFVNRNHFAQCMELTMPAAAVLLVVAARHLLLPGVARRRATMIVLATGVTLAIGAAAVLRCGSRGGVMFILIATAITLILWRRRVLRPGWRVLTAAGVILLLVVGLAWSRLPDLKEGFAELFVLEGVDGNTRWDLWAGTVDVALRSPVVGSGLGSYRHVIGLDKPATGSQVLLQAHNDWLEWGAETGIIGIGLLALFVLAMARSIRPSHVRRLRYDYRYPIAGAALALLATALHETMGFGLQTPLNLYLLAAWFGLVWGIEDRTSRSRERRSRRHTPPQPTEDSGHIDLDADTDVITEA